MPKQRIRRSPDARYLFRWRWVDEDVARLMFPDRVDADDLDGHGTPTLTMAIGLLNATQTDLQVSFASGVTLGQVAGAQAIASAAMMRLTPTASDRLLGLKVTAAAATKQAGQIGMTLFYKAA